MVKLDVHRANLVSRKQLSVKISGVFVEFGVEWSNDWGVKKIWRRVVKLMCRRSN